MGFGKFLPFLALGFLVLYQVGMIQAAPFRSAVEDSSLSEEEEDLLLAILVKEFMKKMASEKEQAALDSSFTTQKRSCNTGTCLTNKLAVLLSKSGSAAHAKVLPATMFSQG
ncbi:PREDICTED: calcitonin gene-related peptide 1 [Myotis brandtii]|uniref:calcitonin gene-related peptide 1 n=1 Tax=Myotis brandtii TaxID=109478 RepID=UPI0003BBB4BB|nr:PREDICTED: calcitonin gene-related peptide 1 [Myotis brandtii]